MFITSIVKSRAFMNMDAEDQLRPIHYLGFIVKLLCYLFIIFVVYSILVSSSNYGSNPDTDGEFCIPYGDCY